MVMELLIMAVFSASALLFAAFCIVTMQRTTKQMLEIVQPLAEPVKQPVRAQRPVWASFEELDTDEDGEFPDA